LLKEKLGAHNICAFTVDHKLREESTAEAKGVSKIMEKMGVHHKILPVEWDTANGKLAFNNIEIQARYARYRLLAEECKKRQIRTLFVGHHLNDQVETMIYRISRLSGNDGLAGMRTISQTFPVDSYQHSGISVIRPLLSFPKVLIEDIMIKVE
jgi:tRNA(Ile)-lysidine synthetase-like protein